MEKTVLQYYDQFVNIAELIAGHDITPGTLKTYKVRRGNLAEFLAANLMLAVTPPEFQIQQIRDFAVWLRVSKGHSNNYVSKNVRLLRQVLNIALEEGQITFNPVDLYKYRYDQKKELVYLTADELSLLERYTYETAWQRRTADLFFFQCYTGMSYSCMCAFDAVQHIEKGRDRTDYIRMNRTKTNEEMFLPLLSPARRVLIRYKFKLPIISNQRYNKMLKNLANILGIRKPLTTHAARKTFADIMYNEHGVPVRSLARMMGHSSEKTTLKFYVNTSDASVQKDMKKVVDSLDSVRGREVYLFSKLDGRTFA